jgi:hypothetical protein
MSKYPAVTLNFEDFQKSENNTLCQEEENTMSMSTLELATRSLANVRPRPSRAIAHLAILDEPTWRMINEKSVSREASLTQMFESLKEDFLNDNRAFFRDNSQFYAMYRQAVRLLGLTKVTRTKKSK